MERRLINHVSSRDLRLELCKSLNIPVCNGKALIKTLNMLGIDLSKVDDIIGKKK
jgi:hypothetical protein